MLLSTPVQLLMWIVSAHLEMMITWIVTVVTLQLLNLVMHTSVYVLDDPRSRRALYGFVNLYCFVAVCVRTFSQFSLLRALFMNVLLVASSVCVSNLV